MLSNKPMTKNEERLRANDLRREKLKRIKEENGEEYQQYLKRQREQKKKRIEGLKMEDHGQGYERELVKGRRNGKLYRERIRKNKKAYRQYKIRRAEKARTQRQKLKAEDGEGYQKFLEKRKKKERVLYQQQRDELHDDYIKTLLMQQEFKKNKITKQQIVDKRQQLSLKRTLRPQRTRVISKQKELINERTEEKKIRKRYLQDNELKFCCKCKQYKSLDEFYPCRIRNPSYVSICKLCERAINKQKKKMKGLKQHHLFERN